MSLAFFLVFYYTMLMNILEFAGDCPSNSCFGFQEQANFIAPFSSNLV